MRLPLSAREELIKIVGPQNVRTDEASLLLHAYDCSLSRTRPEALVHVYDAKQVPAIVSVLSRYHIPFVARASATNHAGSCSPLKGGVVLNLAPLNRILRIDTQHGFAEAEPGVITAELQQALEPLGFFYAPDPASQQICTLGGNLAQNASGARCMKYGGTLDHVLEADVVLPDGKEIHLSRAQNGPDWIGFFAGSEGTLGIITRLKVKILPIAKHIKTFLITFPSLEDCVQTVTDLTAQGIIPRCVEAMDKPTIQAVENFAHAGYPTDAEALLLLELDGSPAGIARDANRLEPICKKNNAVEFIPAKTEAARQKLWKGRRAAYATMAQLAPNVMVADGTVPRSQLPSALRKVQELLKQNNIQANLLFHAGDGNFHPHLVFDERNPHHTQYVSRILKQILQICLDEGGTISGEHGIGVEKRAMMARQYDKNTLSLFATLKQAVDPDNLANPLKIIPVNFSEKQTPQPILSDEILKLSETLQQARGPLLIAGRHCLQKTIPGVTTVSAQSLNQIEEVDLTNYTLTAQAGVVLSQLRKELAAHAVYSCLPPDEGTLGGAFASGCYPDFYKYVTGLEALLPDGTFVKYGGKLTKNAAGYNLIRLFAGSQGKFGMVTKLTFKIFALPVPVLSAQPLRPIQQNELFTRVQAALDKNNKMWQEKEEPHEL